MPASTADSWSGGGCWDITLLVGGHLAPGTRGPLFWEWQPERQTGFPPCHLPYLCPQPPLPAWAVCFCPASSLAPCCVTPSPTPQGPVCLGRLPTRRSVWAELIHMQATAQVAAGGPQVTAWLDVCRQECPRLKKRVCVSQSLGPGLPGPSPRVRLLLQGLCAWLLGSTTWRGMGGSAGLALAPFLALGLGAGSDPAAHPPDRPPPRLSSVGSRTFPTLGGPLGGRKPVDSRCRATWLVGAGPHPRLSPTVASEARCGVGVLPRPPERRGLCGHTCAGCLRWGSAGGGEPRWAWWGLASSWRVEMDSGAARVRRSSLSLRS